VNRGVGFSIATLLGGDVLQESQQRGRGVGRERGWRIDDDRDRPVA